MVRLSRVASASRSVFLPGPPRSMACVNRLILDALALNAADTRANRAKPLELLV